jgi:hypothetical protein
MDQVGVLDRVAVGLVDRVPLVGVAELALGDLGEAVAGNDRIGTSPGGVGGCGGAAAADIVEIRLRGLHVREVGLLVLVVVLVVIEHFVEQSHGVPCLRKWVVANKGGERHISYRLRRGV